MDRLHTFAARRHRQTIKRRGKRKHERLASYLCFDQLDRTSASPKAEAALRPMGSDAVGGQKSPVAHYVPRNMLTVSVNLGSLSTRRDTCFSLPNMPTNAFNAFASPNVPSITNTSTRGNLFHLTDPPAHCLQHDTSTTDTLQDQKKQQEAGARCSSEKSEATHPRKE